jgi:CHAD domain-containing protein
MNSIRMVQSNVNALPPPNADAAILAKLPVQRSSLLLPSPHSSPPNESLRKRPLNALSREPSKKTGAWLGEALLSRWKSYRERLDECRNDPTTESVHELRVAIRRLISQFVLVNEVLPACSPEKARNILKRQLESLGDLRDTHVQQIFIRRQVANFPDLIDLLARLERREPSLVKRASRKIARFKTKKVEKRVYYIVELLEQQSRHHRVRREIASIALRSANAAFADAVGRWRMIDRSDLRTIHRTRVAFKKFRYIVESLPAELTGFAKSDLRKLARYQRGMGNIQDFEVILACLSSFMKRREQPPLDSFSRHVRRRRTRAVHSFLKRADRLFQLWPPRRTSPARSFGQSEQTDSTLGLPVETSLEHSPLQTTSGGAIVATQS